jgi:hypothetical protein
MSRVVAVAQARLDGGDGGIRTLDRPLQAYNGLANRRLQPLGHVSSKADMPDAAACRKRQMWRAAGPGNAFFRARPERRFRRQSHRAAHASVAALGRNSKNSFCA